jgi:hypothetical protein
LLAEFAKLRAENVATLRKLDLDTAALDKISTHPEFGAVTLRQLLATWVAHDLGHIAQVTRAMARQYTEEAGPWRAYLSVLHARKTTP